MVYFVGVCDANGVSRINDRQSMQADAGKAAPPDRGTLLAVVELGGYPNFEPLYRELGYRVITERSLRRALTVVRREQPAAVVAEFNYQSDFRDRTSSLESLLAAVQSLPDTRVVVFYEHEFRHQLERVLTRFTIEASIPFPIDTDTLKQALTGEGAESRNTPV